MEIGNLKGRHGGMGHSHLQRLAVILRYCARAAIVYISTIREVKKLAVGSNELGEFMFGIK